MGSNVSVRITADQTQLQAQLALASANTRALNTELNNLAKQALAAGGATPELNAQLQQVAGQSLAAKARVAELKDTMAEGHAGFEKFGEAAALAREAMGAFGLALSVEKVVEFGKSVFESAEQVYHQSEVLGLSTTAYQDFSKSALIAGVATDTVDTALKRFNAAQGAAQSGLGEQAKAFNDLGVSASLPAEQAIPAAARALLSITDVARRARDETALFGRSGQELNPVLELWAEGTDELTAKLRAMGLMLDGKTVDAAHDAKVAMDTTWAQVDVAWAPAVVGFTGALAGLGTAMQKIPIYMLEGLGVATGNVSALLAAQRALAAQAVQKDISQRYVMKPGDEKQFLGPPKPNFTDNDDIKKAQTQARQIADARAEAFEQGNLRHIESEAQTNDFLLQMGYQTLDQWVAQANELENQKYAIELKGIQDKEKADAGDKVRLAQDQAQEAQLYQAHIDRLTAIDQQWEEKKKQQDAASLQDFIKTQDAQFAAAKASLDQQYEAGTINAAQRYRSEAGLTQDIESEELKRLDATIDALQKGTTAYDEATKQKAEIEKHFTDEMTTEQQQYVKAMEQAWKPVTDAFDQMVDGILSGNATLGQILARSAVSLAENWIKQEIRQQEQTIFSEQVKTAVVVTGNQLRQASDDATAISTGGLLKSKYVATIEADAAKTYADVFAWAAPELGPFAAVPAAAAAVAVGAQAALVPSFDVGTNYVPSDMLAMIHQGERIIPAADNSALMNAVGGGGGAGGGGGGVQNFNITLNVQHSGNDTEAFSRRVLHSIQSNIRLGYLKPSTFAPP